MVVSIPPLRERGDDIMLLAEHFLESIALRLRRSPPRLSPQAIAHLQGHHWPGNVRELENCLERAMVLVRGDEIDETLLPPPVRRSSSFPPVLAMEPAESIEEILPLREIERRYIRWVLSKTGGNKSAAAEHLKIDRKTLRRKLNET